MSAEPSTQDCIFCQIVDGSVESWKIAENELALAFFDINPANEYHALVIPKQHFTDIFDTPEEVISSVMILVKHVVDLYRDKLGIENLQILSSSGKTAQQDVFHFHFHIIPRFDNDGQDISFASRPELRKQFDKLLAALK